MEPEETNQMLPQLPEQSITNDDDDDDDDPLLISKWLKYFPLNLNELQSIFHILSWQYHNTDSMKDNNNSNSYNNTNDNTYQQLSLLYQAKLPELRIWIEMMMRNELVVNVAMTTGSNSNSTTLDRYLDHDPKKIETKMITDIDPTVSTFTSSSSPPPPSSLTESSNDDNNYNNNNNNIELDDDDDLWRQLTAIVLLCGRPPTTGYRMIVEIV